ncbi:hypothetical protein VP01_1172g7 [Puccinia sorghi]|uniref:Uncharacterized protein n=1 Tax=Puccinia sorghi TaxID=27349 RepID=A0A0L6VRF3_9BASI|nr:hypothetical protein VP01_1172g7 [Puccinia sorghi]
MTRPSTACLDRLENEVNDERQKHLVNHFNQFFIQAAKHSVELKAYQKLISESEKNARSDPNSQYWLNQIEEKSLKQGQVQQAINRLITQAVQQIDQHIRTETISIIRALHSDGFFDKPGKNSNSNSTALKTIEKNINNERKEREESLVELKKEFESYRTFNNDRLKELQESLENHKSFSETRFKSLEETHRQQISSLKAGLKLNNQQQQNSPQLPIEQPDPAYLKRLIKEEITVQLPAIYTKPDNLPNDLVTKQSFKDTIQQIKDQIDLLCQQTTEALNDIEPQIKQITDAIQHQITKSTKTVISDGYQEIAILINESVVQLQQQVDKLQPVINSSSEKIDQLESINMNLESQIDQKLNSNLDVQVKEKLHSELEGLNKQLAQLKGSQTDCDNRYNFCKGLQSEISKLQSKQGTLRSSVTKLEKIVTDAQSQFKEVELRIKPLQDRIDGVETSVQNSNDPRHQSPPSTSTALQANHSSQHHGRTSQTPPSPPPHNNSNNSNTTHTFFPSTYSHDAYTQHKEPLRQPPKASRASISTSPAGAPCSQNISIASRLTNAPSQTGSPGSGQINGEKANYHKRTFSRESSHSQSIQPSGGGSSLWGISGPPKGPGQNNGYAVQAVPYEQPQSEPSYAYQNQPKNQQVSSIPLAKRLKNDPNILPQPVHHNPYSIKNNNSNNTHDHQTSYNHHNYQLHKQSQPQQPNPYHYKKNPAHASKWPAP